MYQFMNTRCQKELQEKIQRAMEEWGLDSLILTTPQNIFYATGFASPFMYRAAAAPGTDIAVVNRRGKVILICAQWSVGGALEQTKGDVEIAGYPTWIYIEDFDGKAGGQKEVQPDMNKTFRMAADAAELAEGAVGVEAVNLPYDKYVFLQERFGQNRLKDCSPMMIRLRAVKTPWEIEVLRYSAGIAEKMMNYCMKNTKAGMCEADIMKMWHQSAYEFTGGHEILYCYEAHTAGPEYWSTAIPRERKLEEGDVVRLDGGVNICGYISDLGRTYAVGKNVSEDKQRIFDTLLAARDAGIALLKPGIPFCDVFHEVMRVCREGALPQYVRGHVGHSISLGPSEEYPMLSPDNKAVLEPGMVLCFETPYYSSQFHSYNLEDTILITENGHELFTDTNRSLIID